MPPGLFPSGRPFEDAEAQRSGYLAAAALQLARPADDEVGRHEEQPRPGLDQLDRGLFGLGRVVELET